MATGGPSADDPIATLPPSVRGSAEFLRKWAKRLRWGDLSDSVVMDVGCGVDSANLFNALFPDFKKVIGIDVSAYYIRRARSLSEAKMFYYTADITRRFTIETWANQMEKIVSFYCFNCLMDQKAGFENLLYLLRPSGEAIILTALKNPHYECAKVMFQKPKWSEYQHLIKNFTDDRAHGNGIDFYEQLLRDVGFDIIHLSEDSRRLTFADEAEFRASVVTKERIITKDIPFPLQAEFKEDYCQTLLSLNGRSATGQCYLHTSSAHIIVQKREAVDR